MCITNYVTQDEGLTIVQGVDGIFLCEESWVAQKSNIFKSEGTNQP